VDFESVDGGAGTHDVDNGIVAADFVEMDLVRRQAVQRAFDFGEPSKRSGRCLAGGRADRRLLDDLQKVREPPRFFAAREFDSHGFGHQRAAGHGIDAELGLNRERANEFDQPLLFQPQVDEGAQDHVAADPGKRIEDQATGGVGHLSISGRPMGKKAKERVQRNPKALRSSSRIDSRAKAG
jgi:hypothetical protein